MMTDNVCCHIADCYYFCSPPPPVALYDTVRTVVGPRLLPWKLKQKLNYNLYSPVKQKAFLVKVSGQIFSTNCTQKLRGRWNLITSITWPKPVSHSFYFLYKLEVYTIITWDWLCLLKHDPITSSPHTQVEALYLTRDYCGDDLTRANPIVVRPQPPPHHHHYRIPRDYIIACVVIRRTNKRTVSVYLYLCRRCSKVVPCHPGVVVTHNKTKHVLVGTEFIPRCLRWRGNN